MLYAIYNKNDDQLFWNNELGWVDTSLETKFSQEERDTLNLPIEGVWYQINESIE